MKVFKERYEEELEIQTPFYTHESSEYSDVYTKYNKTDYVSVCVWHYDMESDEMEVSVEHIPDYGVKLGSRERLIDAYEFEAHFDQAMRYIQASA